MRVAAHLDGEIVGEMRIDGRQGRAGRSERDGRLRQRGAAARRCRRRCNRSKAGHRPGWPVKRVALRPTRDFYRPISFSHRHARLPHVFRSADSRSYPSSVHCIDLGRLIDSRKRWRIRRLQFPDSYLQANIDEPAGILHAINSFLSSLGTLPAIIVSRRRESAHPSPANTDTRAKPRKDTRERSSHGCVGISVQRDHTIHAKACSWDCRVRGEVHILPTMKAICDR